MSVAVGLGVTVGVRVGVGVGVAVAVSVGVSVGGTAVGVTVAGACAGAQAAARIVNKQTTRAKAWCEGLCFDGFFDEGKPCAGTISSSLTVRFYWLLGSMTPKKRRHPKPPVLTIQPLSR